MGRWSAAGMGATSGLAQPCTSSTPLLRQACLAASPFPESPAVQWGAPSHSRSACLSVYGPSLSRSMRCVSVCACEVYVGGGWGGVSVLALLTSRRNMLPAPSMSAHTPLPCRLDLTVGGDDGENLGSRRGVDPEESERQRKADRSPEAYLQPTGRSSDSPSWYGSLKSPCWGSLGEGGSVRW